MSQHDILHDFLRERERLLRIAYRIVGFGPDAEDVVQDCWLRWNATDRSTVRNPPAYLSRATAHLSITVTRTAYARRQITTGLFPGEVPDPDADPAVLVERADRLRAAIRVLAGRLDRREQVAYLLREAFVTPYRQVGDLIGASEANARQLVHRARAQLAGDGWTRARPAGEVPAVEQAALLRAFAEVSRTGNLTVLAALLDQPRARRVPGRRPIAAAVTSAGHRETETTGSGRDT
jgi:RNA polymerase sigma factor (sigma-70 family)